MGIREHYGFDQERGAVGQAEDQHGVSCDQGRMREQA